MEAQTGRGPLQGDWTHISRQNFRAGLFNIAAERAWSLPSGPILSLLRSGIRLINRLIPKRNGVA